MKIKLIINIRTQITNTTIRIGAMAIIITNIIEIKWTNAKKTKMVIIKIITTGIITLIKEPIKRIKRFSHKLTHLKVLKLTSNRTNGAKFRKKKLIIAAKIKRKKITCDAFSFL